MNSAPLDNIQQPWVFSPYSLVSWWDMEQFSAKAFYLMGLYLAGARRGLERQSRELKIEPGPLTGYGAEMFVRVRSECQTLNLTVSLECINEFLESYAKGMTVGKILDALGEVENTIRRELNGIKFFFLPAKQADFYDRKELFGPAVNTKFPAIQYDMVEAGNCFAMGRSTACVFHLMRIMEISVQQFGAKLGVVLVGEKNWQNILDGINKSIKALPAKDPTTVAMSQASANLYAVKLAWRNEVMHPKDTYTLEEAGDLIRQVKIFMEQLETIV